MLVKRIISMGLLLVLLIGLLGCFNSETYELEVNIKPKGTGTVKKEPQKDNYTETEQVTLTAKGAKGYSFDHWEGSGYKGNTDNSLTVIMRNNLNLIAVFRDIPTIISTTPANEATEVALESNIKIYFSEPMDIDFSKLKNIDLKESPLEITPRVDISSLEYSKTYSENTEKYILIIDLNNFEPNTEYTVTLKNTQALQDLQGNKLASSKSWSFITVSQ